MKHFKPGITGIILFLLFAFSGNLYAFQPDSAATREIKIPTVIKYMQEDAFSSPVIQFHSLDTTIDNLQRVNQSVARHYNYLSNDGSAAESQVFVLPQTILTDIGFHTYDLYLYTPRAIRYFKTNKAYTEINYHQGGGKEQEVTVALSENVLKNWNVGLDFNRLGSTGFLRNRSTLHTHLDLYTWIHTENERYHVLASACWNTIENGVNGGLHSDSIFDSSPVSNLALQGLLINLADAQHHFRNHQFSLSQYYDLGFKTEEKINDTVHVFHFKPSSRISHSISFDSRSFTYIDTDPGDYYTNTYFTTSSLDSLHYYDLRNRVSLTSLGNKNNPSDSVKHFFYSLALEHQWIRYMQQASPELLFMDTIMENGMISGNLSNPANDQMIHWNISGEYIFAGANQADYKTGLWLRVPVLQDGFFSLKGSLLRSSPEFIYQRYYSNHFIWTNDFGKQTVKNVSISFDYKPWLLSAGAGITSLSNFIYVDSSALPQQTRSEFRITEFFIDKNFRFGKFHFNNSVILQKASDESVLHLPLFVSTHSLFYESFFYNHALLFQAGFDCHFNSSYYADSFMPATGLFYLQSGKKTGGYALADFFVIFRIKTCSVFLKLENIGDSFSGKGYYLVPHYPMQGMTLQFGFRWRFFDQ